MAAEKYRVLLNYEGDGILVELDDLETASYLVNDAEAAQQYVRNLLEQEQLALKARGQSEQSEQEQTQTQQDLASAERTLADQEQSNTYLIWSTKRITKSDQEATILLLENRKKMSKQFADKTTRKAKLWSDIAKILIEKGYNLGETPAEKCRQKFSNLQKAYTKYIINQKTTGSEKMEIPPFFDEINEILGEQHKVNPVSLMDTEEDVPSTSSNVQNTPQPGTSQQSASSATPTTRSQTLSSAHSSESEIENRFSKKRNFKKYTKSNDLIKEIQEDRQKRSEQFEFFKKHLEKTEEQRDKLISILEISIKGTKRKRSQSTSSSD